MLRSMASKIMWVGRATVFLVGLAVIIALTVGVFSQAVAQNNPNQPAQKVFMLGATNTANAMSTLVGSVADSAMLLVDNNGGGPALDLQVEPGQAPMKVNSGAKVENLNADKLDGKDLSELVQGTEPTTVDGHATITSDTSLQVANVPGFGSISAVRQIDSAGNDCSLVFRNESGGTLSRLGVRQGADSSGVYRGIQSGVLNESPSFGNGSEIELTGADAQPRGGFGTWQIVTPDMSKVLTVTVTANFGVPEQNNECDAAVQGFIGGSNDSG